MLQIFNETNTPWEVKEIHGGVLVFSHTSPVVLRKKEKETTIRTSILGYSDLFYDPETTNAENTIGVEIAGAVNSTGEFTNISSRDLLNVQFNHRTFAPFIRRSRKDVGYETAIALIVINTAGKNILSHRNISSGNILEYGISTDRLSLITFFQKNGDGVSIDLYDNQTKELTRYTFLATDGKVQLIKTVEVIARETLFTSRISKFRPTHPTHVVLVHEDDVTTLKGIRGFKPDKHNIVTYTDDAAACLKRIKDDRFSAVTLFFKDSRNDDAQRTITTAKENFSTLYLMGYKGALVKVRF